MPPAARGNYYSLTYLVHVVATAVSAAAALVQGDLEAVEHRAGVGREEGGVEVSAVRDGHRWPAVDRVVAPHERESLHVVERLVRRPRHQPLRVRRVVREARVHHPRPPHLQSQLSPVSGRRAIGPSFVPIGWWCGAYRLGRGGERDAGAGDDAELAEAAEDGEEEVGVGGAGADMALAVAGHHLELGDVGHLGPVPEGLPAHAAVGERAADGEAEVVRPGGGGEAVLRHCPVEHLLPERAARDVGELLAGRGDDELHAAREGAHVEDEAAAGHGLPGHRVAVSAGGHGQVRGARRRADGAGHVVRARRADDGGGAGAHQAAEVHRRRELGRVDRGHRRLGAGVRLRGRGGVVHVREHHLGSPLRFLFLCLSLSAAELS